MCYKVSTPNKDQLEGYFQKEEANLSELFIIEDYPQYFHANGYTRPYLPITPMDGQNKVIPARWKLLPYSVKNDAEAVKYANTLNARCENIFTAFSFKDYILVNRCVVWVNGFFEPNHPSPEVTIPYYVYNSNCDPLGLGGLYADWLNVDTQKITRTLAIITTPANELMMQVHNVGKRMPLVITADKRKKWLSRLDKEGVKEMMVPLADGILQAHPVSNLLYKPRVNSNVPEILLPVETDAK